MLYRVTLYQGSTVSGLRGSYTLLCRRRREAEGRGSRRGSKGERMEERDGRVETLGLLGI